MTLKHLLSLLCVSFCIVVVEIVQTAHQFMLLLCESNRIHSLTLELKLLRILLLVRSLSFIVIYCAVMRTVMCWFFSLFSLQEGKSCGFSLSLSLPLWQNKQIYTVYSFRLSCLKTQYFIYSKRNVRNNMHFPHWNHHHHINCGIISYFSGSVSSATGILWTKPLQSIWISTDGRRKICTKCNLI